MLAIVVIFFTTVHDRFMAFCSDHTIRFRETDAAGVVYFSHVFALCHDAYEAALAAAGFCLQDFFANGQWAIPITRAEAQYTAPLVCGDRLTITLAVAEANSQSFQLRYVLEIQNPPPRTAALVNTWHTCIHPQSRQRQPLPAAMQTWLAQLTC